MYGSMLGRIDSPEQVESAPLRRLVGHNRTVCFRVRMIKHAFVESSQNVIGYIGWLRYAIMVGLILSKFEI